MKACKKEDWVPADGMKLEANALEISDSDYNALVVAGPGAGKTELLAQRACYLLQTNTCKFPHRILAISFKKDAAHNLKKRVQQRCGDELSKRFDSLTFDSFAKQILDRFKAALPHEFKISGEYEVVLSDSTILDYYEAEDIDYFNTTQRSSILAFHTLTQLPHAKIKKDEIIRNEVWKSMLDGKVAKLTFRMIMRLANLIISTNPKIRKYLQQTYQYIFLDEFQDTTEIQYDFFKSCFLDSSGIFTAVGDDKQRIMLWAGAKESIFADFMTDTDALKVPLQMNFRSGPRLVALQNHLVKHLLNKHDDVAIPSSEWKPEQGECFVWVFKDPQAEIEILFSTIKNWLDKEGIDPREICILVKQQLDRYAGQLIEYFNTNGIKARDENALQNLLSEEVAIYIANTLYTIFQKKPGEAKQLAFAFLSNVHTELEDQQLMKLEISFSLFIKKIKRGYSKTAFTKQEIEELIDEIISFANKDRIRAAFPSYRNIASLNKIIAEFKEEFISKYDKGKNVIDALDGLVGKDTIPVMTVHKSKGLEYHTVIFIGLEDNAFWSFERQPDEDKCAFFVALSRAKERVVFTFSRTREGRRSIEKQSITKIKVIFDELEKSKIVVMEEKNGV